MNTASAARPAVGSTGHYASTLAIAGLVLAGAAWGVSLAVGELDAFYIALSIIGCGAVLMDFRIGAVLLILLLPVSESSLFPHSILGMTGLNPMNLLVAATFLSLLVHRKGLQFTEIVPPRLAWLYIVPIAIAGLIGSRHVDETPAIFYDSGGLNFTDAAGYLRDFALKPLVMVVVALLVGAAVAKAQKPERFIVPIVGAVWIMAALEIAYVVSSGVRLSDLASSSSRAF